MTIPPISSITDAEVHDLMMRVDVEYMSQHLLGSKYSDIQKIIYPSPRYKSFLISKRNGSPRLIQEPRRHVKELQYKVLGFLEKHARPPKPCVHGFTNGRSIVSNAVKHCKSETRFLLNIDLENFFPSISFYRVRGLFQKFPFSCSYQVSTVLAHICTKAGELPQGAPTSPFIANLICRRLDAKLMELARRHQSTYTRYADDITFSFSVRNSFRLPENICSMDGGVVQIGNELADLIVRHGFSINAAKSRVSSHLHRLEVTGLTINKFPNVKREFIDRIRGALHAWERYGYDAAQLEWKSHVERNKESAYENKRWRRQRRIKKIPELSRVLWGKLLHLRMVRGPKDSIYTRLAVKFNDLASRDLSGGIALPVTRIVCSDKDVEMATYVVEWEGEYQLKSGAADALFANGSAFAYGSANQLITCEHVFRVDCEDGQAHYNSGEMHNKKLVVKNPFLKVEYKASIVKFDLHRDLAVLQIEDSIPLGPYFVARETKMEKGEQGWLIGYPNWHPGKPLNQTSAPVSNRYMRSGLQRLEIGELIRQGNSGGPFVDESYQVAGVAQTGATQTAGNNECLTVDELDSWL